MIGLRCFAQGFLVIQHDSHNDDETLDNVLQVRADANVNQAVADDLEDDNTDDNAGQGTGAALHGDTTHNTGRDGVHGVVSTHGGVGRTGTACFQHAAESVEQTSDDVDDDDGALDVDTADLGSLAVAADGEHILTQRSAVPDDPHDRHNGDSVEHQVAQADIANADGALAELGVGLGKAGQGVRVADRVEVLQAQAVADELHAQGCNEGCNAPVGNDEAMGRADDAQYHHDQQQRHNQRQCGDLVSAENALGVIDCL